MTPSVFYFSSLKNVKRITMPKPATRTKSIRTSRNRKALSGADCKHILAASPLMTLSIFVLILLGAAAAQAQSPLPLAQAEGSSPSTATQEGASSSAADAGINALDDRSGMTSTPGLTAGSLSSNQIIDLLQRNPDLVVELKSLVADRMQEQGAQIDANDISDQMLYDQIATNANLRASITTFLRARGYVTDDDLQAAGSNADLSSGSSSLLLQPSKLSPGSSDAVGVAGAAGASTRQSRVDASGFPSASASMMGAGADRSNPQAKRGNEQTNASTDLPQVLRRTAPYNLRSMRDLYTQIPDRTTPLRRFGSQVFVNRDASAERGVSGRDTPLDVPLGPDYVLGAGDTLQIDLWGGVTQSITRAIDRDGRILLPEAGSLQVAGLPLERAQSLIEGSLKTQFRNAQVAVTVSRLRSVRVYVVGDVQRPGGYDISSLATPLSALYAAGGPTSVGSLRIARHMRGSKLIEEIDLYDFLLHGVRNGSARFESGDTLLVPPAGLQVAVSGAIKRPAIYELKAGETTLTNLIYDAGGFTAAASLGHITIERIDANKQRETVTLHLSGKDGSQPDHDALDKYPVKDGDRIRIEPILPYSERAIYLEGHVVRPGRAPFTEGMRLSDVLNSYRDLLPEPASQGEIIRLVPPDLHAETIDFNLPDVLIGNANADLQPFDTIRILGRYEVDAPKVIIRGEVLRPGSYPLSEGMTAAQLVRMAGGFKRDALLDSADLTSYGISDGKRVVEQLATVHIGAAVSGGDSHEDVPLKPGDILSIHQITGWNDIGESLIIDGQVRYPGSYGFKEGERLSSVLRRAGGFLSTAYPMGAVLVRNEVRDLEQKSREELIRQIETNSAAARLSPNLGSGDGASTLQLIKAQQDQVLADLKSHPPTGRMVIHISADIDSWANSSADIELRRGDVLTIPKQPGFVLVTGQVYNATALTFAPDKTAGWYLSRAGGTNTTANRKEIFIIRANGTVIGRHSAEWGNVLSTKLNPGDVIVVPQKIIGASLFWKNLLTTAQLASSIAITAAVASI
jgi:protein involved in polysaccharide export with SLBB domain